MAVSEMVEQRVERRLAAILVADMVGYCRQLAADEESMSNQLERHDQARAFAHTVCDNISSCK